MRTVLLLCLLGTAAPLAQAQTVYVTDEFEVTLRTGPSTSNKIVRMLSSGARLEQLETTDDGEYVRVRTESGSEGWVLARYLIRQPVARERLQTAAERVRALEAEREQLRAQMNKARGESQDLGSARTRLESENRRLTTELSEIREASANVLVIREENERLRQQVNSNNAQVAALQDENERLRDSGRRDWFLVGAAVLLLGTILGLILPRLRWRRRSSWGEL